MLVAIEGAPGSGKTTVLRGLKEILRAPVLQFPDRGSRLGRILIARATGLELSPSSMVALAVAHRYEYYAMLRRAAGSYTAHVVVEDYLAALTVRAAIDGLDSSWVCAMAEPLPIADVYVLLDVSTETSQARRDGSTPDPYDCRLSELVITYRRFGGTRGWAVVDAEPRKDLVYCEVAAVLRAKGFSPACTGTNYQMGAQYV